MIILAGAIILTLSNNGIIGDASQAVKTTNLATAKNIADLAWAEAYANGVRTVEDVGTTKGFKSIVSEALAESDLGEDTINDYVVHVTTNGVNVVIGWKQEGLTVRREDKVLTIGDDIEYDETLGGTIQGLTDVNWKVLGASESGELLIMSTTDVVSNYRLGFKDGMTEQQKIVECQNDWLTAIEQLDNECKPYGKGKGATGARSINIEDVDKITGYDKTLRNEQKIANYGDEMIILHNELDRLKPTYTLPDNSQGTFATHSAGFHYYNGNSFEVEDLSKGAGEIVTLKADLYSYFTEETGKLDKQSEAYKMLFEKTGTEDLFYWISSRGKDLASEYVGFGLNAVYGKDVAMAVLFTSTGKCSYKEADIRAVVSLAHDIEL